MAVGNSRTKNGLRPVLLAATLLGGALVVAPPSIADTCDPSVTVCQGSEVEPGSTEDAAPSVAAPDEQYPFDDEWYFNPAGGGTALQPNHPSGGGGGGGGGHH